MKARVFVFPVKGRIWCFTRSLDKANLEAESSNTPSTLKELWNKISSSSSKSSHRSSTSNSHIEVVIDFVSNKMNKAWVGLEQAPEGSIKRKLHGLGLKLLARVKPSEVFLKSISKEVSAVEVTYPSSLNARLVRRRLRHIAMRGSIVHKQFFYASATLVPLTSALSVLPLPNVPFFWALFRTYSHWRALQGSEKLLQLVSDSPEVGQSNPKNKKNGESKDASYKSSLQLWKLQPSKQLEELVSKADGRDGLSKSAISEICKTFHLNTIDALKYRDLK